VQFHVYSWQFFNGQNYAPQVIGSADRVVSLLFEQDFSSKTGGRDHYEVIIYSQRASPKGFLSQYKLSSTIQVISTR
jgi:hypothetical protein